MQISIVTPCFNSGEYIEDTLNSIKGQSYTGYEHIVIDGLSTDSTLSILNKYNDIKLISEQDNGQSDAINKGFNLASGDIYAWQNADDLYFQDTFQFVIDFFEKNPDVDLIYGDYELIDENNNWICDVYSPEWDKWLFKHGRFCPVQPVVFWRKEVHDFAGPLSEDLNYTMDVNFYSKASQKFNFRHVDKKLGAFRVHNDSKTQNRDNRLEHKNEYLKVLSSNFQYKMADRVLFEFFYLRSRIASFMKRNYLKRL